MIRTNCLCCGHDSLHPILDLGMHPFADSFIPAHKKFDIPDKLYPLALQMCPVCHFIQTMTITDPKERYGDVDYSYTSSNSAFSRKHWDDYANEILTYTNYPEHESVLEIGSNDGYLLKQFKNHGCLVLGVDASKAMSDLANKNGIRTIHGIFGKNVQMAQQFDFIVANNVFNHSDDPYAFLTEVRKSLKPNGLFVFELPYWKVTVDSGKWDQIYHEHVSYFTVTAAAELGKRCGMRVHDVQLVDYHGGSIRVFMRHTDFNGTYQNHPTFRVDNCVNAEIFDGLFNVNTYTLWQLQIQANRTAFLEALYTIKAYVDYPIICAGAAAKGNTFLNYYRLDASIIDFVTDASEYKIGKLTPGTRIPILSDDALAHKKNPFVILTSWNLADKLKLALWKINPTIRFINPDDLSTFAMEFDETDEN